MCQPDSQIPETTKPAIRSEAKEPQNHAIHESPRPPICNAAGEPPNPAIPEPLRQATSSVARAEKVVARDAEEEKAN